MNILQVVPELSAGGVERVVIATSTALSEAGHHSHIASCGGRLEGEVTQAGGYLHPLDMKTKNPLKWRQNAKALARIITDNGIDLVHAHSRAPAFAAHKAAHMCGVPFITTYHGIYNANSKLKRAYNAIMTRADIIIANSQYTASHILEEHKVPRKRITVVPCGVDLDRFNPDKITPEQIYSQRAKWGVSDQHICLLLPGRLTSWKGQLVAVKALAELADPKAILVLLGDAQGRDHYVKQIEELTAELGLSHQVFIAGHSAHMPIALMAADIVLSASTDPEAFGLIAAEAQAMGRWVVASDHGGARETILGGVSGTHVAVGDPRALAHGIKSGLNAQPDLKTLRAHIEKHFSERAMKHAILQVYKRALQVKSDTGF